MVMVVLSWAKVARRCASCGEAATRRRGGAEGREGCGGWWGRGGGGEGLGWRGGGRLVGANWVGFGGEGMGEGERGGRTFVVVAAAAVFFFVGGLVENGAVLEAAEVEHADGAVGAAGDEDVDAVGAEADVEDFFVVGDQLRFCGQGRDVPDGAGGVDAGGDDEAGGEGVPVEGGEGGSVLGGFGVGEEGQGGEFLDGVWWGVGGSRYGVAWFVVGGVRGERPEPEMVARCCE